MDMRNIPQLPQIRTDPHPLGGRRRSRGRADIPVPTATEVLCDSPLKSFVTNDNGAWQCSPYVVTLSDLEPCVVYRSERLLECIRITETTAPR